MVSRGERAHTSKSQYPLYAATANKTTDTNSVVAFRKVNSISLSFIKFDTTSPEIDTVVSIKKPAQTAANKKSIYIVYAGYCNLKRNQRFKLEEPRSKNVRQATSILALTLNE